MKKGYIKTPREKRVCEVCTKEFEVLVTSSQKYCSQTCAGKIAIRRATNRYVEKRNNIHQSIKAYIIQWSIDNKEIVSGAPLNKIKTTISPLIENIQDQFGVKTYELFQKLCLVKIVEEKN